MSITFREQIESRRETVEDDRPTADRKYAVIATGAHANESAIWASYGSFVPLWHSAQLKRVKVDLERVGPNNWWLTAEYERPDPESEAGPPSIPSFDISTSTVHVENSVETLSERGPDAIAANVGGSNPIDYDGTTVRGADILEPVFSLSVTQTLPDSVVTNQFLDLISSLVGKTNRDQFTFYGDSSFAGWGPGDVLFVGASGNQKDNWDWEVNFRFAIKPAFPEQRIARINNDIRYRGTYYPGLSAPARPGWSYLWFRYAEVQHRIGWQVVPGGMIPIFNVIRMPVAAVVDRVYPEGNLNLLQIEGF